MGPEAQVGIVLRPQREVREALVTADVQRPEGNWHLRVVLEQAPVNRQLLLLTGELVTRLHEQHLGSVQAHAGNRRDQFIGNLGRINDIGPDACGTLPCLSFGLSHETGFDRLFVLTAWLNEQTPFECICQHGPTVRVLEAGQAVDPEHGNSERFGQDGRMRQSGAPFHDEPAQTAAPCLQNERGQQFRHRQNGTRHWPQGREECGFLLGRVLLKAADDIPDISRPLGQQHAFGAFELLHHFAEDTANRCFGRDFVAANQILYLPLESAVPQQKDMGFQNLCLGGQALPAQLLDVTVEFFQK